MITADKLTPAQNRWMALVKHYFAEIYEGAIITHRQLIEVDEKFRRLLSIDKKYKVSWPIWLIMNNQVARGTYRLPIGIESDEEFDEVEPTTLDFEFESELKKFGIVVR